MATKLSRTKDGEVRVGVARRTVRRMVRARAVAFGRSAAREARGSKRSGASRWPGRSAEHRVAGSWHVKGVRLPPCSGNLGPKSPCSCTKDRVSHVTHPRNVGPKDG